MRYPRALIVAALGLVFVVSGCANDEAAPSTDSGKPYNDTDVAFATDMIQHHAQALEMADLTAGWNLDPQVASLPEEIRGAQAPEIEEMVRFLSAWDDQPIPETSRDHVNAHGDGGDMEMNSGMPGMMSGEEMQALEAAPDSDFQAMWLAMMIEHHQGAIEMAQNEQENGKDTRAVALAEDIVSGQAQEVSTMQRLLDG